MAEYSFGDPTIHNMPHYKSIVKNHEEETSVKPKLTIKKEDKGIVLSVTNYKADAMRVFSKRSSEEKFSLLAQVSSPSYTDNRPNLYGAPELREYIVHFIKNDKQVGIASDVVLIIKK